MTAEEIRKESLNYEGWLREIAAQLAELVEVLQVVARRL
jgi:hypothetical protein